MDTCMVLKRVDALLQVPEAWRKHVRKSNARRRSLGKKQIKQTPPRKVCACAVQIVLVLTLVSPPHSFVLLDAVYVRFRRATARQVDLRTPQACSCSYSLTHSLTHSINHSLTHSLTHSLAFTRTAPPRTSTLSQTLRAWM